MGIDHGFRGLGKPAANGCAVGGIFLLQPDFQLRKEPVDLLHRFMIGEGSAEFPVLFPTASGAGGILTGLLPLGIFGTESRLL